MTTRITRFVAVLFACFLATSVLAPVAVAATPAASSIGDAAVAPDASTETTATVDPALQRESGKTEIVVRLPAAEEAALDGDREAVIDALQSHASRTQAPVLDEIEGMDGVTVERTWWITNAIMVTADLDRVDLSSLASIDGIERLHADRQFEAPAPIEASPATEAVENVTYGLDQIDAPEAWDAFNATGDGVRVAVADTGVDDDHPDIELAEADGWVDLAGNSTEPVDNHGHGTHVSGTISGGNASGTAIGVAPDVELGVARVCLTSACDGQAILDSFEWAVQTDSDVLSMSLGGPLTGDYIEPVRNSMAAGTLVVASIGNSGEGTAGSPGAVYDSLASGATDEAGNVTAFSGGMLIDTDEAWGEAAPDDWPAEYITPDAAAPGAEVFSSNAYGGEMCGDVEYCEVSGTSMSAPHKSGAAAAILSTASEDIDPYELTDLLTGTAWKPDYWDESMAEDAIGEKDTRYGHGIIDVHTAAALANTSAGIEGTVTDADGTPIEGVTVTVDDEFTAETDENGAYAFTQLPGNHTVSVDPFGYEAAQQSVTIENHSHVADADFALQPQLDAAVAADQPDRIEGGESLSTTLSVANLESITVSLTGEYDEADAALYVDGTETDFGEPVTFDDPFTGDLEVMVETSADTSGELGLEHGLDGLGETLSIETGPTMVFEDLVDVAVVDDTETFGADVAATLDDELPMEYAPSTVTSSDLLEGTADVDDYDAIVVQNVDPAMGAELVNATDSIETGVVYLDQWGSTSNGIPVHSDVTGEPADTFQDDLGTPPVIYELQADHPIFDGVGDAGDTVDIHTGSFADLSWFENTSYDVLAASGDQDGIHGDAFAIDEESATIFASSLGYTPWAGSGDYTEDADAILANSVQYLVESSGPEATISLEDVTTSPGETVDVDLSVDTAIAGYEATVSFDPDVVQVTDVDGVDMADPIVNVDNDAGTISLAQGQADEVPAPTVASIEFEHVGDAGDETDLVFDEEETAVNDANGHLFVATDDGSIGVAPCDPGDVNADGDVTTYDVTLTQQFIVGQEPTDTFHDSCADVNADGVVTPADVTLILQDIVDTHGPDAIAG
ncbi:S8 family serine peptidase [Halovivax limisalsi]|uniref:S8 family serine peptidase n=1 Tax=Halovivax limisalsi TaxID=1453760 RepID=UPI001FFCFEAB|nr:S8 family serine peptidase [Halovivax limisalsi]